MVSKLQKKCPTRQNTSKNVHLQSLIFQILENNKKTGKGLTVNTIQEKLWESYRIELASRTVSRNLNHMLSDYELVCIDRDGKDWEESNNSDADVRNTKTRYFKIKDGHQTRYEVKLTLSQVQLLMWAIMNLRNHSTEFFKTLSEETRQSLMRELPQTKRREIRNSMQVFTEFKGIYKKPNQFSKNNLVILLASIRKRCWITAKVKDHKLNEVDRHVVRRLAIGSLTFKNNVPYVIVFDEHDSEFKSYRATRLNSIHLEKEKIPKRIIDYIADYEVNHERKQIKIRCKSHLAQIFRESKISATQKLESSNHQEILVSFNMRVTHSFVNFLLPHIADIISISPHTLKEEIALRTRQNHKALQRL